MGMTDDYNRSQRKIQDAQAKLQAHREGIAILDPAERARLERAIESEMWAWN